MENRFQLLEGDDHVLSVDNTTLRLGQLREEIRQNFTKITQELLNYGRMHLHMNQYSRSMVFKGSFTQVNWMCSPREGIDCEVLTLGAKSWQKGKLRIQCILEFLPAIDDFKYTEPKKMYDELRDKNMTESDIFKINVVLEFCPEQATIKQSESPLDDLRQMLNENNL